MNREDMRTGRAISRRMKKHIPLLLLIMFMLGGCGKFIQVMDGEAFEHTAILIDPKAKHSESTDAQIDEFIERLR